MTPSPTDDLANTIQKMRESVEEAIAARALTTTLMDEQISVLQEWLDSLTEMGKMITVWNDACLEYLKKIQPDDQLIDSELVVWHIQCDQNLLQSVARQDLMQ